MDEPFGAVDPVTRQRLQQQFLDLQRELKKTIVFVTHDIEEAAKLGDRIAVLSKGGVLEQYDTPARDPRHARRPPSWPTSSARTGGCDGWPSRPLCPKTWCSRPRSARNCP